MEENKNNNYQVQIIEKKGTCDTSLFEKMAKTGDIESTKIENVIGEVVEITGFALCEITVKGETFKIGYFASNIGLISTGSEVFYNSVKNYIDDIKYFTIAKVKTGKGHTYKAVPYLNILEKDRKDEIVEE